MLGKLNEKLGGWKRETPFVQHDTHAAYQISCVEKEKDIEQVHVCLAFPGLTREHPQKYALAIFNTLFGGGMSSRLFQKIREENGLTYSIYSYTTAFADTGVFTICASMNPNQTERVFELIAEELKEVTAEAFPEQLIAVTKEQMISNFIIGTESTLNRIGRVNGSSGLGEAGYDPATNTLSYLCNITGDADSLDFTAQPLTLLVTPPVLRVNGVDTAVTNHPAILTFQPSAVSQTLTGSYRHGGFSARAVLSPLSIYVEVSGGTAYRDTEELVSDTSLLLRDGSILPAVDLIFGFTGGGSHNTEDEYLSSADFTSQFQDLLDVSQVAAVQVGDIQIPLE